MSLRLPHRAYVFAQLVVSLREAIAKGEWRDRLPSERVLAGLLKVSRMTVRKALAQLQSEGAIGPNVGNAQRRIVARRTVRTRQEITVSIVRRPDTQVLPELDLWQLRLQLRLAQLGIASEVLFFSDRQLNSERSNPQNWITARPHRLWLLIGSSPRLQRWFADHAREQTLVLGSSSPDTGLSSIDQDYRAVGRHAGGLLSGRHHRHIALLGLKQPVVGDRETEEGFRSALTTVSGTRLHIARHDGSRADIYHQLDLLLKRRPAITALFIYKTSAELTVLIRLLQHGVRIPEDLSVLVRDESGYFDALPFDLAHYRIRPAGIVDHAIKQIEQFVSSPSLGLSSTRIISQFHEGTTVARLASVEDR